MSTINIGIPIDLQKLIDTRLLIQAGSGGGKSYALRKVMEAVGDKAQQIIIDPEGEFVTLREKFNFALVSKEGDIPLNLKYAETLAHKILETNISVIIDLYELKHHERIAFVRRFVDALVNAPKELWHYCLVYVDEAHIFCPESSKSESMSSIIDLCTRGRKRGFAAILATQRLSKLHKDAAAECLNKMIGRTGLDIDRKRAAEELGFTSKTDTLELRNLVPGEFFGFGPAINNEVIKFKVDKVITTHLQSGKRIVVTPPTPSAIKKILNKLSDIPEEAERELRSKKEFQEEIIRLKRELSQKPKNTPVVDNNLVNELKAQLAIIATSNKAKDKAIMQYKNCIDTIKRSVDKINTEASTPTPIASGVITKTYTIEKEKAKTISNAPPSSPTKNLGKCPLAILRFLASFQDRSFTKAQIGVATGYSPNSGGFNNAVSELASNQLISRGDGRLMINRVSNLKEWTGEYEVQEYSINTYKSKLGKCEAEIYQVLLDNPDERFTKEGLAQNTPSQYSFNSGGFNNAISALNTLELIKRQNGTIQLNPELLEI